MIWPPLPFLRVTRPGTEVPDRQVSSGCAHSPGHRLCTEVFHAI